MQPVERAQPPLGPGCVPNRDGTSKSCDDVRNARVDHLLDTVLDQQFALFKPGDLERVGTKLGAQRLDLIIEPAMFRLQAFEVRLGLVVIHKPVLVD